jgi:hypothetical protein
MFEKVVIMEANEAKKKLNNITKYIIFLECFIKSDKWARTKSEWTANEEKKLQFNSKSRKR